MTIKWYRWYLTTAKNFVGRVDAAFMAGYRFDQSPVGSRLMMKVMAQRVR